MDAATYNNQFFAETAGVTTYTVYELTTRGLVLSSSMLSKSAAIDFARDSTDTSSQVYVFKSKCIKSFDPVSDDGGDHPEPNTLETAMEAYQSDEDLDYTPETNVLEPVEEYEEDEVEHTHTLDLSELSGMYLYNYGRGFVLLPQKSSSLYGEKYLMHGWWMPKLKGWFFKESEFDELQNRGVVYVNRLFKVGMNVYDTMKTSSQAKSPTSDVHPGVISEDHSLKGFTLQTYGKGLLLSCRQSRTINGAKYLYDDLGIWNSSANGWFFKMR